MKLPRHLRDTLTAGRGVDVSAIPEGVGVNLAALPGVVTEAEFHRAVIDLATANGWRVFSLPDSRRVTSAGWVDLVLAHEQRGEVIFAELKKDGEKPRKDQLWWHAVLRAAGCRVVVWRPAGWKEIETVLGGR